jgi:ribonucleotide monophosphatase NagD (HAD superfamily)
MGTQTDLNRSSLGVFVLFSFEKIRHVRQKKPQSKCPNIKDSEILMVDDSMDRDLKPAKQLGLRTALALYGRITEEEGTPDYELADIKDLSKIAQA